MPPLVTILLPVRNAAAFLPDALDSVLRQTFTDFELLAIDDASTDGTAAVLGAVRDPRVRVVRNPAPLGVARTLNRGLDLAAGRYVARMDGDDLCEPDRLRRQVAFMEERPAMAVSGSWIRVFGDGPSFVVPYPVGPACLKAYVLFDNPLAHPAVTLRLGMLRDADLRYDESCPAAQDYELWARCARHAAMDNLSLPLLRRRIHAAAVTQAREIASDRQALLVVKRELERLSLTPSAEELQFHREVGHGAGMVSRGAVIRAEEWLLELIRINDGRGVYPPDGMRRAAGFVWTRLCLNSAWLGSWLVVRVLRSPLTVFHRLTVRERTSLLRNALRVLAGARLEPTGRIGAWPHGDAGCDREER